MTPAAVIVQWVWALSQAGTLGAQVHQGEGRRPAWKRPELAHWISRVIPYGTTNLMPAGESFWVKEGS